MKFLLAAVNAKYIHSNLGIYSLRAYANSELFACKDKFFIELGEYTINQNIEHILEDIYKKRPDAVGFSCYIWNIETIMKLVRDLQKVLPDVKIWLGGPEVSYNAGEILEREPGIQGIMLGEGEETFTRLMEYYIKGVPKLDAVEGLAFLRDDGTLSENKRDTLLNMDKLPFSYTDLDNFEHRIIYYESSRGCPFSCSYCLSSIDKRVRLRSADLVKKELDFFLAQKVPQVKFVDRTFNCNRGHAMAIWSHILENDNGVTNFHFEISADLLSEEELQLLSRMRPGLVQLEIGVQSTNLTTIKEIRRTMDLGKLAGIVKRINHFSNIHQHLDLIAGLPHEDFDSFAASFNAVYAMEPEQLQLGFLKVLKGSYMEEMAADYGLLYRSNPPYEVLSTRWIHYGEILKLKSVEDMVEVYYNSGQFRNTLKQLVKEFPSPFSMFFQMAGYYEAKGLADLSHNRLARYEILFQFISERPDCNQEQYRDLLVYDLYLRENVKSRPAFARDQSAYKEEVKDFFIREAQALNYLPDYKGYDSRQISKMAHIERFEDGNMVLFDYKNRDPLTYNARSVEI